MSRKPHCLLVVFIIFVSFFPATFVCAQTKVVLTPLVDAQKQPKTDFYACDEFNQTIPDGSSGDFSLTIPESAGIIKEIEVVLFIKHPFSDEIKAELYYPGKGSLTLFDGVGGQGDGIFVHLDDDADTDIGKVPYGTVEGRFNLQGSSTFASFFNGLDASKTWTLTVSDKAKLDAGTLISWGIYIVY